MTKISTAKRSFIIVFIVMFIISLCMGGLFVKYPNNVSANAEDDKTYTVKELFSVDDWVTITDPQKVGTGIISENDGDNDYFAQGSVIKSDKPYTGEIVPTFKKDASLVFKFVNPEATTYASSLRDGTDNNGDFKFYITDLTDESNYFIIHFTKDGTVQVEVPNKETGELQTVGLVHGGAYRYPRFNNITQNINFLNLYWSGAKNDELNIITSWGNHSKCLLLLASFNGVITDKIQFPNGYKITFASDWETGTDIAFRTILGKTIRDTEIDPSKMTESLQVVDTTWKENTEFALSDKTVTLSENATLQEIVVFNGMEIETTNSEIKIPQYAIQESVKFHTAWNYDGLLLKKGELSVTTWDVDTSKKGNTGTVSVIKDGVTYTCKVKVTDPIKPTILLLGSEVRNGFTNKAIVLPAYQTADGNTVEVSYTLNTTKEKIENFTFTPTEEGIYKIEYIVTNIYGVTNSEFFNIEIIDDVEKPVISVAYTNRVVAKGTVVEVPTATATDNADGELTVERTLYLGEQKIEITDNRFTTTEFGDYILTYTCTDSAGNTASISYTISSLDTGDLLNIYTKNLINVDNATIKTGLSGCNGSYIGLGVSSTEAYTGRFNAIFEGDKELIFNFSGSSTANASRGDGKGDFYFQIADANNPNDYFTVHYSGDNTMGVYVTYKGEKRYCDGDGNAKEGTIGKSGEWLTHQYMVGFNSDNQSHYNKLGLEWQNGVLSVIVNCERFINESSPAIERTVAKFDGSKEVVGNKFGLPKLNWSAYTISFGSNYTATVNGDSGSDINFFGLNGETDFFNREMFVCALDKQSLLYNGKSVVSGSTINVTQKDGLDTFYALGKYDGLTLIGKGLAINGNTPTAKGVHNISIVLGNNTFNYTIDIRDEFIAPSVQLKDSISILTTIPLNNEYTISAEDVIAYDDSCGDLDSFAIGILVKQEGAENFAAYTSAYKFNSIGRYIVRYVAKDASLNEGYVERIINVVEKAVDAIIVNGEICEIGYLKHTIQIPLASMDNTPVAFYVTYNGQILEIENNTLTFTKTGIYSIVYGTETNGIPVVKEYIITVIEDMESPIITVNYSDKTLLRGTEVVLPTATAMDNVDGEVSVSCKVTFGATDIVITDNRFTLSEIGAYTVTYTSVDMAGKVTTKRFVIHSVEQLPAETPQPGTPSDTNNNVSIGVGCNSSITDMGSGMLLCVFGFVTMVLARKKRRNLSK